MKDNFKAMTKLELRNYIMANRDDKEAFSAYMNKVHNDYLRVHHAQTELLEPISNYPNFCQINTAS